MKMSELLFHAIHVLTYYSLFLRNGGVFEICAARLDDSLELEGGTVSREEREGGERRRKWSWGGGGDENATGWRMGFLPDALLSLLPWRWPPTPPENDSAGFSAAAAPKKASF